MKCENHPEREAIAVCVNCQKGLCEDCKIELDGKNYCRECYNKLINSNETRNQQRQVVERYVDFKAITVGLIVVLILTIILAVIFSYEVNTFSYGVILTFISSNPNESLYIPFIFIAALITGFIAGKNPKKAILNGILTGLIGTIIIYLIMSQTFNTPYEILDNLTILTVLITMTVGVIASFTGSCFKIENLKSTIKLQWKPTILIGLILPVVLGFINTLGLYLGTLLATIYVGSRVDGSYENGIIHGIIVGIISSLILYSIIVVLSGVAYGFATAIAFILLTLTEIIITGLIGAIGGLMGILISKRKN